MDLVTTFRTFRLALNELSRNRLVDTLEWQVLSLQAEIETLRTDHASVTSKLERELALANGELDRCRLILMPMTSPAGAAYVNSLAPRPKPKMVTPREPSTWDEYVAQHVAQMEAEDETKKVADGD